MQIRSTSLIKLAAVFAVCGFLFGVSGAGAATDDQGRASHEVKNHGGGAHAGGVKDSKAAFLQTLADSSACQSSCCWATCPQEGGYSFCSDGYCEAWCPDGSFAWAYCSAT